MRGGKLAIDPLWQCLCPSWSAPASTRTFRAIQATQRCSENTTRPIHTRAPRRTTHQVGKKDDDKRIVRRPSAWKVGFKYPQWQASEDWSDLSIHSLHIRLNYYAAKSMLLECQALCRHLIQERGQKPDVTHFNALILANANDSRGTIWRVRSLLEEMDEEGIEPDVETCHAILRVTAVHLDQFLRADTLEYMRNRWLQLNTHGHHDVAVGLLREGCLELALDRLDMMRDQGVQIGAWLLDMFAYALCDAGEIDTAFQLMKSRVDSGEQLISRTLWYYLIDAASEARHGEATEFIWKRQVDRGFFHVGSGICLNVLATAAQAGNAVLATDVLLYMERRDEQASSIHFQLLIDAYMNSATPDIKAAFGVLSTMVEQRVQPTAWHTRSIFLHLRDSGTMKALEAIEQLHQEGRSIPIAALNVLINCHVHNNDLESAMQLYKRIHEFKGQARTFVDAETFNHILKLCRNQDTLAIDTASFIMSEMTALDVKPDEMTIDRLILLFVSGAECAERKVAAERLDRAMECYRHAETSSMAIRAGTISILSKALADVGDRRCLDVLQYADDRLRSNDRWALMALAVRNDVVQRLQGIATPPAHEMEPQHRSRPALLVASRSQEDVASAF